MKVTRTLLSCRLWAAVAGSIVFASGPAQGQEDIAALAAQLEAMKQQIAVLESRLENAETKAESAEATANEAQVAANSITTADGKTLIVENDDGWWKRTTLGGYGEMHLNLGDKEQIDFHRWVLFLNHQFTDRIGLVSEVELEHSLAGDGAPGEVELEQAYLEFDLGNDFWLKTGLYLLPVGIINETHEPNTFYGTERNLVESEIIPTTWWEGGLMLSKNFDSGFGIDVAGHSALDVPSTGGSAFRVRSGRQKVAEALAEEGAGTVRFRYNGIPGLSMASSIQYQSDITQADGENNDAWFYTAHVDWRRGPLGLRALGGYWDIAGPTPASLGLDQQFGYYLEPSYRFYTGIGDFGVFGRWGQLDAARGENDFVDAGVNYWPIDNIVFKADWRRITGDTEEDTINFGVGYAF